MAADPSRAENARQPAERPGTPSHDNDEGLDRDPLERFAREELVLDGRYWVRADNLNEALLRWYARQGVVEHPHTLELRALLLENLVITATTRTGNLVYLGVALSTARQAENLATSRIPG